MTASIALAGSTSSFTQSLSSRTSAANAAGVTAKSDATSATKSTAGNPSAATVVSLSRGAIAFLLGNNWPQKDFKTVTLEARAALDTKYADLKSKGTPFSNISGNFNQLLDGFERRSLYAISSNSGGLFSEDEQNYAFSVMSQQQGAAMSAADPLGTDVAARYKGSNDFLDKVSPEEKTSVDWAVQRAAGQYGYEEGLARAKGEESEGSDAVKAASALPPLVKIILAAMRALKNQAPHAISTGGRVKDLKDMPLFKGGVPA
jgi:hypothetical protein